MDYEKQTFEQAHKNICKRHNVPYIKGETDNDLADRICINKGYKDENGNTIQYINSGYINIDIFEEHECFRLGRKLLFGY